MACDQKTLLLISAYADGEAMLEETREARTHLEQCGDCRKLLEDWRGQRTLFEWAYSLEMPEKELIRMEQPVREPLRTRNTRLPSFRWTWVGAGALASAIAVLVYSVVTLPPILQKTLVTKSETQAVRVKKDIELQVGPDTKIERIGDRSIRLLDGWVSASVRHGTGFRVLARRIQVTDQGTRFTVGSGPKLDYLLVEEGSVVIKKDGLAREVKAGQVATVEDRGKPSIASLRDTSPDTTSTSIGKEAAKPFAPSDAMQLEWQEGLKRLARRFPDIELGEGRSSQSDSPRSGPKSYLVQQQDARWRKELSLHYLDLVGAMAGQRVAPGDWEIPVQVMLVSGVMSKPELPLDIYYIRLVPSNGTVVWRFTGANGAEADYPITSVRVTERWGGVLAGISEGVSTGQGDVRREHLRLVVFPGEIKPELNFTVGRVAEPAGRSWDDMLKAAQKVSPRGSTTQEDRWYLDEQRQHRLLILGPPYDLSGSTATLRRLITGKERGTATAAVIATDQPLVDPPAPAGTYLLRLIRPAAGKPLHWEIATTDSKAVAGWGASSRTLRVSRTGHSAWTGHRLKISKNKTLALDISQSPASQGAFEFDFRLAHESGYPLLAKGCFRVRQPK